MDTTGTTMPTVRVDVFADVACPWCFIARRRLQRVLAAQPEGSVQVRWRAYELEPALPPEGVDARAFFLRKFGGEQQMLQAFSQVAQIGADEGIRFDFARMRRAPNTLLAHQAIVIARGLGRQEQMVEALLRGHFEQGADVADRDQVLDLAERHGVGLDRPTLGAMLERRAALPLVRADLAAAARRRVNGVPFFVTEQGLVLTGAQPPQAFQQFLDAARQRRRRAAGGPANGSAVSSRRVVPSRAAASDLAGSQRLTGT